MNQPSCTKRLKVQYDRSDRALHNACNWLHLDKPAIEYHDLENVKTISYRELKAAKETVSSHLKFIERPEFIGINFDISESCVPSLMLGILESGHAFFNVPADPLAYAEISASVNARYIFARAMTPNRETIRQVDIHGQSVYLTKLTDVRENFTNREWCRFAYAIATSGSTGAPKTIKVPHPCILPNIADLKRILDVTSSDKIAQLTNFTFDPSVVEIFLSLCCAATLFMASKALKNEAVRLLEKMFCARATVLQITPSLFFHQWSASHLRTTILDKDSELRILLLGGEPFPSVKLLLEASHPRNATRLFNIYGITEVSCWSSIKEIVKNNVGEPRLGEPLSETVFQIRNEDNEVIIRGDGTLYIGSTTRVCIVGNEAEEDLNKPVFRDTGDIVLADDHGIFFRGRRNNVVKRFGNKVNLRELERVTTELSFVRNCATFWDAESHKLYLCLSTRDTKEEFSKLKSDVMSHLKILPAIHKPDKIIILERFNFTPSGKICQASLREVCRNSEAERVSDLHSNANEIFENLWSNHIKSKDAGFLMSGGTSISALQISSAAAQAFNTELPQLIGMLLKDLTFDECVNYIKSTLINCGKAVDRSIDMSLNDNLPKEMFTEDCVLEQPSRKNFPLSSNEKLSNQWYKCRGKTYGDALMKEGSIKLHLENISSVQVLATYNLQKAELYATVASHSGIICTANLLKTDGAPYEVKLPDRIEASVLALADFRGIVGCYDGYVYCIHLKTGDVIWKFRTQDMVKCTAITCVQGSKIFVGSYDFHVYCLSTKDGTQIWKTKASHGGICATGCLHQSSTSVLFGTLDGSCLALQQSSGRITWKRKLQDPVFVAPVVLRTGYALFCSVAGTLCCFDIEADCQVWRYVIHGNVFSYPVIWTPESLSDEHVILASHNKNLYCLEVPRRTSEENEPKLRYTLKLQSPIFATSWCEEGRAFVACTDGAFKVFDLLDGKLLATKQLPGETFSSPVVHNDLTVLGCRDNNLYVLKLIAS
ncbi:PREDICTED: acyl-CoA synthetase family member 4 isoform X2 [Vollenhovia emeryi]|uniref:acyl-CoA synthetase family member 4 isoform X2 n=1 Tax=Vollenhovia emeryi TaxID=411798 RepID=UPI0005F58C40|nr:PREDICTED: acyl-CoA synthetase family member 4 isoform X2 [Vollenhovia emeryi]